MTKLLDGIKEILDCINVMDIFQEVYKESLLKEPDENLIYEILGDNIFKFSVYEKYLADNEAYEYAKLALMEKRFYFSILEEYNKKRNKAPLTKQQHDQSVIEVLNGVEIPYMAHHFYKQDLELLNKK